MSRIDSVNFAIQKSKNNNHNLKLSVVASDAFFLSKILSSQLLQLELDV